MDVFLLDPDGPDPFGDGWVRCMNSDSCNVAVLVLVIVATDVTVHHGNGLTGNCCKERLHRGRCRFMGTAQHHNSWAVAIVAGFPALVIVGKIMLVVFVFVFVAFFLCSGKVETESEDVLAVGADADFDVDVLAVGADVDDVAVAGSAALDDNDDDDDDVVSDSERVSIDSNININFDSAFDSGVKWGFIPASV